MEVASARPPVLSLADVDLSSRYEGATFARWTTFKNPEDWGSAAAPVVSSGTTALEIAFPAVASACSRVQLLELAGGFQLLPLSQYGFAATERDVSLFTGVVVWPSGQRRSIAFSTSLDGSAITANFSPTVVAAAYQVLVRHATQGLLSVEAAAFSTLPPGFFSVPGPSVTSSNSSLVRLSSRSFRTLLSSISPDSISIAAGVSLSSRATNDGLC